MKRHPWESIGKRIIVTELAREAVEKVLQPRRERGVVVEECSCCGKPTDSDAHINHCRS